MSRQLSQAIAAHPGEALAVGAPDRDWLTYAGLMDLSARAGEALRGFGIGANDRVAIVLPNGPEMATAFWTIAGWSVTAPLNPAYKQSEYEFYLEDLGAKAVVLAPEDQGPAFLAAEKLGVAVLRAEVSEAAPAGSFELTGAAGTSVSDGPLSKDDTALILHTSGTTSRPKIVPLLQSNVVSSARHIADSLALTPEDRCLNVMPLFHIHGLIAAVSATLLSGGSIYCTPGFNALTFFATLKAARPSWYTAVPTMHQAILARADRNAHVIADVPLRFLRSSSASLPGPVMERLAATFGAPVIEAYGMTEAAHQMCANPMCRQIPGSVGVPAGPEVRIADEAADTLIAGQGEVVISGPNVTPGYESNPNANTASFFQADGRRWFRTGDQGSFDADGFLTLTGRLKEIINRGGEKVSPLEVDGILMEHPSIDQVVTFALPHPKLGEEVAAAVVLKDGEMATEQDIRAFAETRLAAFKVPRKILILEEIPKGATGKLQRIGLAEKLGLT